MSNFTIRITPQSGAVLFDMDGTLADTDPLHAKAWQLVAAKNFGITFSWEAYRDACLIEGISPIDFIERFGADVRATEIAEDKARIFRQLVEQGLTLLAGVTDFIALIDRAGIPMGIVSSSSRRSVDTFVSSLWPARPPAVTVSREDTLHQKPSPEPYLFALEHLRREPRACLAVEDTNRGILSASRAGLPTIKVSMDAVGPPVAADLVVADLRALEIMSDGQGAILIAGKSDP